MTHISINVVIHTLIAKETVKK